MRGMIGIFLSAFIALQPPVMTPAAAKQSVGKDATVCGTVKSTRYAEASNRKPTFLNLDKAFPDPLFTIVIFDADRAKFDKPEEKYRDKDICVTGRIHDFRGTPEIVVTDPKQITDWKR
jgi:DNA/RNA endonuclease YhcR with UshA esterase domain